jgi:hypothetical protein
VVLCDLEGRSHREAARQLGLANGTFARHLIAGRKLLAERLTRRGVVLSGGALAAALSQGTASAQVAAPLMRATVRAAVWAAAGHLAAVSGPVALLTRGVLRAMFLTKLKIAAGVVLLVAALGAGGLAYRPTGAGAAPVQKPAPGKPSSDLEALRRENELLKLNLEVVLEKVRAQEAELRTLRSQAKTQTYLNALNAAMQQARRERPGPDSRRLDLGKAEAALKALREAKDDAARKRALEALGAALRTLQGNYQKLYPGEPRFMPLQPGYRDSKRKVGS